MGLIQIILTIIAWRKGWKWRSLFPMIAAFTIGVIIAFNSPYIDMFEYIWIDVIAIIILIFMCFKKPSVNKNKIMFCEKCGKEVYDEAVVCLNCGCALGQ